MSKILKNTTGAAISLDIGITVPANSQVTLAAQDFQEASQSDDIVQFVGSGAIVVNDSFNDLTKADGINYIQGKYTIDLGGSTLVGPQGPQGDPGADAPTDHGLLTGLGDDDHTQYLTEVRHDSLPSDNPHSVNAAQVGLGNVDNTSDANKPVSTAQQTALNNKYDASNPNNFINSAGAPVQPGDISNFETTTQLNTRDTNNRNRANHTGTQLSNTISNFDTEVSNNTSVTANTSKVSFPEAPTDGQQYARQNSAWNPITSSGTSPWLTNANGINYNSGNVGVDTDNPIHNIQVGEQFNDAPTGPARVQNTEIAQYSGTATNNGTAQIGLYESVPSGFPGDYGARIRYNASTNLLIFATVQAGFESTAFTFDRATQVAQYFADINMSNNQIKSVANATDQQDALTLSQFQDLTDAVKVRNTAVANVNTGVATFNNFTTTDQLASTRGQFTFATNGVTPNFTGKVDINFNAFITSNSQRVAPGFRWSHNGNVGPWTAHTYIRNGSGHNESSANFSTTINVVAGQPIQIQHDNLSAGGNVAVAANAIEFIIKRRS